MPVYKSHLVNYQDLKLGEHLRAERQRQGLTLSALASRSNISIGRLSQIENGQHVVDIRQAFAIAQALAIPPESLLPDDISIPYQIARDAEVRSRAPRQAPLVRTRNGEREQHHNSFWPLADLFVGRHIEPLLGHIIPVSDDNLQFCYHHSYEFAFVLKGAIEFLIKTPRGLRREELRRGDCVYFRSDLPHYLRSLQSEPAESIQVFSDASVPIETGWDWLSPRAVAFIEEEGRDAPGLIGREMSALRDAHRWTIKEVSRLVGLRERQLEQIERGKRPVPLDVMMKLARAFGKPLRQFIRDTADGGPSYFIQRSEKIPEIPPRTRRTPVEQPTAPPSNVFYPLAGDFPTQHMYPYFVRLLNVDAESLTPHEHHGQEFIYVLDGELELTTYAEDKEVKETLRAGDSCFLDSSVPHLLRGQTRNPYSQTSAEVIDVFWCPLGEGYLFSG